LQQENFRVSDWFSLLIASCQLRYNCNRFNHNNNEVTISTCNKPLFLATLLSTALATLNGGPKSRDMVKIIFRQLANTIAKNAKTLAFSFEWSFCQDVGGWRSFSNGVSGKRAALLCLVMCNHYYTFLK
jgi:hypothetical protein